MIRFHLKNGEFGWLSNFAPYPISLDGASWPTVEHHYQASKFVGEADLVERIRLCVRPYDAWRLGRVEVARRRSDWDEVKEGVMGRAIRAKFSQHPDLRERLVATGELRLVEHSPSDSYWGDGGDGSGLNRLGEILMQVRSEAAAERSIGRSS